MSDLSPEEFLDGWALWQEHRPQSGDDWRAVARRSIAAEDYEPSVGSPMFQALYAAEAEVERLRVALAEVDNQEGLPAYVRAVVQEALGG